MHVIGHRYIGMNHATMPGGTLSQPGEVCVVIVIEKKDRLPIVAPLNDMRSHIRQVKPGFPWHENILVLLVKKLR